MSPPVGSRDKTAPTQRPDARRRRFDEFARRAQLSEKITAARLKELVDEGLLERRPYHVAGQRSREDHHLTDKGTAAARAAGPDAVGRPVGTSQRRSDSAAPTDIPLPQVASKRHGVTAARLRWPSVSA
jgi:DNA-binding MarR family transcriptional regulator